MRYTLFLSILAALLLNSCGVGAAPPETKLKLATYQVPQGYQDSLVQIMNDSFMRLRDKDSGLIASAEILPNGTIALLGPESVQQGFASLVSEMEQSKKPNLENGILECWVVLAKEGTGQRQNQGLMVVDGALKELSKQGNYDYFLLDKLQTTAALGQQAQTEGPLFRLSTTMSRINEYFSVETELKGHIIHSRLDSRLNLKEGQFAVIAESRGNTSHQEVDVPEAWQRKNIALFYIIRVRGL